MPSAEAFDAFAKLSATALAFIAIFALYTRRVRTKSEMEERISVDAARQDELRQDRDAWKAIANSALGKLDRLTDVVERLTGTKFPDA